MDLPLTIAMIAALSAGCASVGQEPPCPIEFVEPFCGEYLANIKPRTGPDEIEDWCVKHGHKALAQHHIRSEWFDADADVEAILLQ